MPSNHLIFCCPLFLPPSIFPSFRVFSKESGGQCIGVSASTSVLPKNIQDWFLEDGLMESPCCPRGSQESSSKPKFKSINSSTLRFLYIPTLTSIYDYWKNHSFDEMGPLLGKVMSLLFNMLSRFVKAFLPRSKCLLISWLQSPGAVMLEPPKWENKISHYFHCFSIYLPWCDGTRCHDLSFLNVGL